MTTTEENDAIITQETNTLMRRAVAVFLEGAQAASRDDDANPYTVSPENELREGWEDEAWRLGHDIMSMKIQDMENPDPEDVFNTVAGNA